MPLYTRYTLRDKKKAALGCFHFFFRQPPILFFKMQIFEKMLVYNLPRHTLNIDKFLKQETSS